MKKLSINKEQEQYLINAFRHASYKKFENIVIEQIFWNLFYKHNILLELITQQTVIVDNKVSYLDGYIPALNIQIEVDEAQHKHQKEADLTRQISIEKGLAAVRPTEKLKIFRIDATKFLQPQIEKVSNEIAKEYKKAGCPEWIIRDPKQIAIKNGYISVEDNLLFKYHADILNILNYKTLSGNAVKKTGTQKLAYCKLSDNRILWFPGIKNHAGWINNYDFENDIFTTQLTRKLADNNCWYRDELAFKNGTIEDRYLVFHCTDSLNRNGYKYFGKYKLIESNASKQIQSWKRISTEPIKIV